EVARDQMLIYVNDKPRITSRPETERLLAGNLFAYRIQVDDRNSDARIDFRLESGPEGMVLDRNGILTWRTNETHHDNYQVVISATDGFDKDVQTFILNINAQLTLTSTAPHIARPQKPYTYEVSIFQPGSERQYTYSLPIGPEGMTIGQDGIISWTPSKTQLDTQRFQVRITDGVSEDIQDGWVYVNAPPRIVSPPLPSMAIMAGDTLRLSFAGRDPNGDNPLQWVISKGPLEMTIDSSGQLIWPTNMSDLDAHRFTVELSDGMDKTPFRGVAFVNSQLTITSTPLDSAVVGRRYAYQVTKRDDNLATLLKFRRPTVVTDMDHSHAYRIEIQDDKYQRDLQRYLARFKEQKNIYVNKPQRPAEGQVAEAARVDLKEAVTHLFVDNDDLIVIFVSPLPGAVELEDVLWEFFEGGRGVMPKYQADPVPLVHYSLREFPDGMQVSDDGVIIWTPTPTQAGRHQVRLSVSDGYTKDEQAFQMYANYIPAIISQPDTLADAEARFSYLLQVDDRNEDAQLNYRLIKAPDGMQVDSRGLVTWLPTVEQLNWQEFIVEVSDGYGSDQQATTLFVNMSPRVISQPKPVALNNYEYAYRLVAEDLNRDPVRYKAIKLPRYSEFDARTGLFKWRPRSLQKGPNDVIFEITDSHGGVTLHEFQVHVFQDPSRERFLFTSWPLMMAFAGVIFVLGLTVGG
ncbi:MAG: Ig domain-containing protein, partial [Candidatus Neomarinimicrobiota bacterium]